ncbi:RNA-directed DNA polymerase (Reverse transcriptase), partial [Trifolium medium]|nr:RNA-directed DNA polymerase (Reverse transcriptase) [Trifolium medium]
MSGVWWVTLILSFILLRDWEFLDADRSGENLDIREFGNFATLMGLIDLPLLGRRFTWFKPNGSAASCLVRFLSWQQQVNQTWMAFMLKEKLKVLKANLKVWNKEVFRNIDRRIETLVEEIKEFDLKVEDGPFSLGDVLARSKGLSDLWGLLRVKELQLIQRSRSQWLKEGDANTGYFHASVKERCRKNSILALRVGDRWVESVSEVRAEIVDYFTTHFSKSVNNRPTLDGIVFQGVDPVDVLGLTVPFSATEIEEVVLRSDGDKSPDPDGFNFAFFKRFWGLL